MAINDTGGGGGNQAVYYSVFHSLDGLIYSVATRITFGA